MNILGGGSGELKKLIIKPATGTPFTAMINPESIDYSVSIQYNTDAAPGADGATPRYTSTENETMSFDLIIDGTGVVDAEAPPVVEQIENFKKVTLNYQTQKHEPQVVTLEWGNFNFTCRLQQLNIAYTLFAPDGSPLRAELSLTFIGYLQLRELNAYDANSPDLTHVVMVKSGDTLPLLCEQMYGDSALYLQVAKVNGLVNFRKLQPGTELVFPPIQK